MRQRDYSYRDDPAIPEWDDTHGLIVFDGVCVLCCGFVQFILRHDNNGYFRFTTAQSALGQALYRHCGLDSTDFETNLVITEGRFYSHAATIAGAGLAGRGRR